MYCRHREGHSLLHNNIAMPSPQKCLLHADWETLSVAGHACPAGLQVNSVVSEVCVCICMCGQSHVFCVCVCVCVWGGGGGGGGYRTGELKPMRDSANIMSTHHSMQNN